MDKNIRQKYWNEYQSKVITTNYKPKFHPQLDPFFSFQRNSKEIEDLVNSETGKYLENYSFLPFIKTISKTPRYKYYKELEHYKLSTKKRPIFLTAHKDKYVYGFYSFCLNKIYQEKLAKEKFKDAPIAYRSDLNGKCNIQFSKEIFDFIRNLGDCVTILTDITSFFDNINHEILKDSWVDLFDLKYLPKDFYKIYRTLTSYKYINLSSLQKEFNFELKSNESNNGSLLNYINGKGLNNFSKKLNYLNNRDFIVKNKPNNDGELKGIPQGLSISAVLSNVYMWDFDKKLNEYAISKGGLYRRYCDDVILVLPDMDFNEPLKLLEKEIVHNRKMKIKAEKTKLARFKSKDNIISCTTFDVIDIKKGILMLTKVGKIQYLGFTFDGKDVLVRNSSISRYYRKMSRRIRKTIRMAYSDNSKYRSAKVFKKQIFLRYTHLGKRNFVKYIYDASSEYYINSKGEKKEGHNSKKMNKQVSKHMGVVQKLLKDKNLMRYKKKKEEGRNPVLKKV